MTHSAWVIEMKAALALSERQPLRAADRLKRLADKAARVERQSVTTWHVVEALGAAALVLSERRKHKKAGRLLRAVIRRHEQQLAYHGNGIASALASAAVEAFADAN